MLTTCPGCRTTFHVTPAQLRARSGMVRCGKCSVAFNALDGLHENVPPLSLTSAAAPAAPAVAALSEPLEEPPGADEAAVAAAEPAVELTEDRFSIGEETTDFTDLADHAELSIAASAAPSTELAPDPADDIPLPPDDFAAIAPADEESSADRREPSLGEQPVIGDETEGIFADQAVDADTAIADLTAASPAAADEATDGSASAIPVRDCLIAAGLVAARESTQIPGNNKWAEGTFAAAPTFSLDAPARPGWPFAVAIVVLFLLLALQAAHHWRGEIAARYPALRPAVQALCATLRCDVPLPRHASEVVIESSDLQADQTQPRLYVLNARIRNRAPYQQDWPLLELSLTNKHDEVLIRRILKAEDYLPAASGPAFAALGEARIRLWLQTAEIDAAGYRLYVFYP